jgi:hypothetical protein
MPEEMKTRLRKSAACLLVSEQIRSWLEQGEDDYLDVPFRDELLELEHELGVEGRGEKAAKECAQAEALLRACGQQGRGGDDG